MGEPQKASEVLIDGKLYDITNFRHPGGNIMKFYAGHGDATEGFNEFHIRSKKARKMLHCLPHRDAPDSCYDANPAERKRMAKLTRDFKELTDRLRREGWYDPSISHCIYRTLEIVVLHIVALYLMFYTAFWVPGLMIIGIATGRCGWLMHEGGHHSMTGNIAVDIRLQEFFFGFGAGMSAGWWRTQHNRHHATPQKLKHDVDLDTLPLVAFNKAIALAGKKSSFIRSWIPLQGYMFGPFTCSLVALGWQLFLHPRHIMRRKLVVEAMWIALRWATIAYVASLAGASVAQAIGCFLIANGSGASYIFMNFALSHTHLPVTKPDEDVHWVEYSSDYTINIAPHFFTNWWMGYLNYQIEHHMFPCMPQYRFTRLWPQVKELFEANGLKYDVRTYFGAMKDTVANLHDVGTVLHASQG